MEEGLWDYVNFIHETKGMNPPRTVSLFRSTQMRTLMRHSGISQDVFIEEKYQQKTLSRNMKNIQTETLSMEEKMRDPKTQQKFSDLVTWLSWP